MLIKLLSPEDRLYVVELAVLIAISDSPLLWNKKTRDQIASDEMDLEYLSFKEDEQESDLISELVQSVEGSSFIRARVESSLLLEIKKYHKLRADSPATRLAAAKVMMDNAFEGRVTASPAIPKIAMFELVLVALRDGSISEIQKSLLKHFQNHYQMHDFIVDEIIERAEALTTEVAKAISLVLE